MCFYFLGNSPHVVVANMNILKEQKSCNHHHHICSILFSSLLFMYQTTSKCCVYAVEKQSNQHHHGGGRHTHTKRCLRWNVYACVQKKKYLRVIQLYLMQNSEKNDTFSWRWWWWWWSWESNIITRAEAQRKYSTFLLWRDDAILKLISACLQYVFNFKQLLFKFS